MYFRHKKTAAGKVLQLVESFRDAENRPRQRIIISLGNAGIPKEDWGVIAKIVEKRLYGFVDLFEHEFSSSTQRWIDTIMRRIDLRGRWVTLNKYKQQNQSSSQEHKDKEESIIDGVIANKVSHNDTTLLGPILAASHAWKQLQLDDCLAIAGFNKSQQRVAAASVISRLVDPVPENGMNPWIQRTSLPELLGDDLICSGKDRFYRVSDKLLACKSQIESHLRGRERQLFSLDRTIFLYDLTNTYFEGTANGNPKAKRGKSKEKRNDCPQVVIGMVFDQNGFELGHEIFEGNRNDATTLVDMLSRMQTVVKEERNLFSSVRPLVILDGGIATKKNLQLLRENGFEYLVNDSRRCRKTYLAQFREDEEFTLVEGRDHKPSVRVRTIMDPVGNDEQPDRLILCKSNGRQQKENAILSNAEKRFLEAVKKLSERVLKGRLKKKEKIDEAVGRLLSKHPRVARFYTVSVEECDSAEAEQKKKSYKVTWKLDNDKYSENNELFGCYVLRTNSETDLSANEIWSLYVTLTRAEEGFRCLKSSLGLRPVYHHKEDRVDSHIFITVLAYHLLQFVLYSLRLQDDNRKWETIRRVLSTHCYTTITLPTKSGEIHRIRKAGVPDESQKNIYRSLGINWKNLPVIANKNKSAK